MRYSIILAVSIFLIFPAAVFSATYYVPKDFGTIQEAIDACVGGDVVIVSPGTYVENIKFTGADITLQSQDGPGVTAIDGNKVKSVVTFKNGNTQATILDGFTITNGIGNKINPGRLGGGIYCQDSSPTIRNNIIVDNEADNAGGGIYYKNSSPLILNNRIEENASGYAGGGIGNYDKLSSGMITGNIIRVNSAKNSGGGILCTASTKIIGNLIGQNSASYSGGVNIDGPATIMNNTICYNIASGSGGGLTIWNNTNPSVSNNHIYRNQAGSVGGGILVFDNVTLSSNNLCKNSAKHGGGFAIDDHTMGISLVIVNTIIWDNQANLGNAGYIGSGTLSLSYSDVEGGQTAIDDPYGGLNWGPGMIDSNPLFVDEANGDFHLTYPSPCRDTGDNSAIIELYDFEGDPRIAYGTVDMGADEFYTHLYWMGDATPGGNVEVKFVGLPGTAPVGFYIGTGVLDPPLPSMWGDWYLKFPVVLFGPLGSIPGNGVMVLSGTLPGTPPPPYSLPMQALIGAELSNLSILEVK